MKFKTTLFTAIGMAFALAGSAGAAVILLSDNFDTITSFTASPNADQSGVLASATYSVGSLTFPDGYQRRGTGVLELGYDGTNASGPSRVFTNADYVSFANANNTPIQFSFNFNSSQSDWTGFVVGTSGAWLDSAGTITEFSALLQNSGGAQRWVNGANATLSTINPSDIIKLELRNTAGTGSAFNGTGSVAQLWSGATSLGTMPLGKEILKN